jgi:molybdopterin-guanine dinucleotide biosynthesis protein A
MGTSKAALPHRGGSLLGHVVGVLQQACAPVLVVGAPGRELPPTPGATVLRDDVLDRGPLAGVARGLAGAADAGCGLAVVCATDLPLLAPAVVLRLLDLVGPDDDVVVPVVDGQVHPLCAVYRTGLAGAAAELAADAAPVRALLRRARTREVGRAELLADPAVAAADPGLASVRGANTPAEWAGLTGSGAAGPGPAGE